MRIDYSQPLVPQLLTILKNPTYVSKFVEVMHSDERTTFFIRAFNEHPSDDLSDHIITKVICELAQDEPFSKTLQIECIRAIAQIQGVSTSSLSQCSQAKRRLIF